jgi:nucleotide-binding universal stress UspA family protein
MEELMEIRIQKILCPADFSEPGKYAFNYACAVARRHGASLEILHVAEASAYAEDTLPRGQISYEESLRKQLERWAQEAGCPAETRLLSGIPYIEIVKRAREIQADMIVISTHGRTGMKHLLIGSVAERVVRTASCPVLTVRHPDFTVAEK